MNYTEIEMEWMKEILRDKEEEIKKLKSDLSLVIKERDDNIKQNKKLKSDVSVYKSQMNAYKEKYLALLKANTELVEENRRLKEAFEIADMCVNNITKKNEKLKSDLAFKNTMLDNVSAEYDSSQDVIKKLKERIRFLEQCLDNKEKVNKSLREENKRLSDFLECEA